MPPFVSSRRVHVVNRDLAVHFGDGVIAGDDDIHGEPGIGFGQIVRNLDQTVDAAGLIGVFGIALKDLGFIPLGVFTSPSEPILAAKIDAAVAEIVYLGLDPKMKILVVAALAEQVAPRSAADEDAVFYVPLAGLVRVCLPAGQ